MVSTPDRVARRAYRWLPEVWPENGWLRETVTLATDKLAQHAHGDLPRWLNALDNLPEAQTEFTIRDGTAELGAPVAGSEALRDVLMEFHPWRKGPLRLGGLFIDTEWRSDWKWERIEPHVDLAGKRVLDIGCGNGYFGYRMLEAGASLVVGIDPTLLFIIQWLACRHFSGDLPNAVLPLGIEELPVSPASFDVVCSMGVLYHRKDPLEHLHRLNSLARPGGMLVLETLILPEDRSCEVLVPEGRYAAMRNVWAIPGTARLTDWLKECGFRNVRIIDISPTTIREQRSTEWMQFESLEQALDRNNLQMTREGHPAPVRAVLVAECPGTTPFQGPVRG
jgi:tRNA (mo5U34)-methyltransferase